MTTEMVVLEVEGVDIESLADRKYKLVGLDTPTPYLFLDDAVYQGEHELIIGTELIFSAQKSNDGERDKLTGMRYQHAATKRILFKRVVVEPRTSMGMEYLNPHTIAR